MDKEKFSSLLINSAQTPTEFWHFVKFLEAHKKEYNNIIEIGVYYGATSNVFKELLSDEGIFVGIDTDEFGTMNAVKEKFKENKNMLFLIEDSNKQETADKSFKALNSNKIDLLFIDGGHSYENVKLDYHLFKDLVRPGGVIAFHDATRNGNVRRFISTIVEPYDMDKEYDFRIQIDGSKWTGHCGIVAFVKGDRNE